MADATSNETLEVGFTPASPSPLASTNMRPSTQPRVLLDTRRPFDARLLGYDGARDPNEDGEGLVATADHGGDIPGVKLVGPDGEVFLCGRAELLAVHDAIGRVLSGAAQTRSAA